MHALTRRSAAALLAIGFVATPLASAFATTFLEPVPGGAPTQSMEQSYVTTNVNLRAGPGTNHRVVGRLRQGDFVNVGQCQGAWCPVQAGGQPDGWVSGRFIGRGANPYHNLGPAGPGIPPQEPGTHRR